MLYPKTLQRFISLHSMEVKEVDSDWNEENQLVCSCQNKMADRRTVYQKTSGSTTFDPKPTTRHVYRVPDLFGQVHQERSIKALFWCLEPLLLHQPPNLIVPKKKKNSKTTQAWSCRISAWKNNDVRLPVSILLTVIWHVNLEWDLELQLVKKRLGTKSTDCRSHGPHLSSSADWRGRYVENKTKILA
jgi:hypothetical protein